MRVLVTGGGGQLARAVVRTWRDDEVLAVARGDLDVADEAAVHATLAELRPDVVVHAGAWTDVDACEGDPDAAHRVNALGAWWVARAASTVGARLVHVSTDYVFGGAPPRDASGSPRGWEEVDPPRPLSVYGRTKLAGERLVHQVDPQHVVVRTAWLAAPDGGGFVDAILAAAATRDELEVVADQVGCPTTVDDLAPALRHLAVAGRGGTYHLVNAGRASRAEQAAHVLAVAGSSTRVCPVATAPGSRPAPRPTWSVLDTRHARLSGVPALRHWREAFGDLVATRGDHEA